MSDNGEQAGDRDATQVTRNRDRSVKEPMNPTGLKIANGR